MTKDYGNEYLLRKEEQEEKSHFLGINDYEKTIKIYELIDEIEKKFIIKA